MSQNPARGWMVLGAGALACTLAVTACGAKPPAKSSHATTDYTVLTPKPTSDAGDVVWSTYRETQTLDPIQAFDYPENTVDPPAVRLPAPPGAGPDARSRHRHLHRSQLRRSTTSR